MQDATVQFTASRERQLSGDQTGNANDASWPDPARREQTAGVDLLLPVANVRYEAIKFWACYFQPLCKNTRALESAKALVPVMLSSVQ
jgi:hypothetical protein